MQEALDLGEITSTTTGLELDADSDSSSTQDDLSTTMDMNESRTIRRQLEGLESMYSEVSCNINPRNIVEKWFLKTKFYI